MSIELKIPNVGESVQEVQIGRWLKSEGDSVEEDESVVELESDKATVDLPAPISGVLTRIVKQDGDSVSVGDVIAYFDEGSGLADASEGAAKAKPAGRPAERSAPAKSPRSAAPSRPALKPPANKTQATPQPRGDAQQESAEPDSTSEPEPVSAPAHEPATTPRETDPVDVPDDTAARSPAPDASEPLEEVVPMSLIRRRIAQRLVAAQQNAALLSTFNEIDMSAVSAARHAHGERFREKYAVKLGLMSFFVKAAIDALRQFPAVNAEIRADKEIVYRHYYHIGIAIGGGKGLVVPVLRNAELMSFAEIEQAIGDFARRAEQNKLMPDELAGGTFTISNGGVYGSLLSTPIVNPPQSGVLGMHAIQDRPVVRDGQIVVRPMMYVALSYDHRIIDGREAVLFLKRIKETVEDPARMLFEA